MSWPWISSLPVFVLSAAVAGCGAKEEPFVEVQGAVVFAGAPLTTGVVSLRPARGNATWHQPTGAIDANGRYRIFTSGRAGAPPGWYRVVVFATEPTIDTGKVSPGMPKSLIPARYNRSGETPLEIEVQPGPAAAAFDLRLDRD